MLIEYIRKPGEIIGFEMTDVTEDTEMLTAIRVKGKPYGCMVAVLQDDTISLGWSLCSPRDQWDRDVAQNIAWARATSCENYRGAVMLVPQSIAEQFEAFMHRSMKYFQTDALTADYGYEYTLSDDDVMVMKAFKFI